MKMMMPTSSDLLRKHRMQILLLTLLTLMVLLPGSGVSDNRVKLTTGFVAAVGVEVDENGHPMLAEYDSDGRFVADVGHLGLGELEDVNLYPAASWRAFELFHQNLQSSNPIGTQGATLMSAEQYKEGAPFMTNETSPQVVNKPELFPGTKSVYVIAEDRMIIMDPAKEGFILAEYPIALHEGSVPADAVTLLLDQEGKVVRASNYDISFKAAVYKEDGRQANTAEERLWLPLPNVRVDAGDRDMNLFPGGQTVSGADGRYTMSYAMPPCPGFSYSLDIPIIATLDIENFNPKKDDGSLGFMVAYRNAYKTCVGYGDVPLGTSLGALSAQLNAQAIVSTIAIPLYNHDITFSTMQLNAIGTMPGVRMTEETVYTEDSAVRRLHLGEYDFDFNLDGIPDTVVANPGGADKVDIYISPNTPGDDPNAPNPPDFTRLADYALANQLGHQGLLSEISQQDLEDTDIYIYRRSTGQLLGTIEGLAERQQGDGGPVQSGNIANPKGQATYRGVHTEEESGTDIATFGFTSFLVGAVSDDFRSRIDNYWLRENTNRRPWLPTEGRAGGFTSDNPPDGLRPGEVIQVIAINRATGYIGSQNILTQSSGVTLSPPSPILMGPPNLKIIASREFEDFNELSRSSDQKINIIGSEGAGLTSDTYVKIQTVWLAQNGDVLPDDLPGYTGRLAISTGSATEDFSGNFEIKPGYQTQVVQLNNASDLTTEHFYVQVVGEHFDGNPVFESPGAGEGKLQTRPKKYVPLLVPLFDEASTRAAEEALAIARLDGIENLPERVEPTYRWAYRPEMQFSVYELARQRLQFENAAGDLRVIDLSNSDETNPILVLNDNLDFVDLLYDLIAPNANALAPFSGDRELVFAIGAEEVLATVSADGSVQFNDLAHISSLQSEDFLSIRLYANNDSSNILWDYSFEYVYVESTIIGYENQTDDIYYITADDPIVDLKAGVAGYAYRLEEDKYQGKMIWNAQGSGSFLVSTQESNEFGLFDNTLVMPTTKGATADVSVVWQDVSANNNGTDDEVEWKKVEVLAGAPTRIVVSQSGAAVALAQGDLRLDYTLYDAYNNLVEDGTEIELDFADSLILKEQELSTIDGKVYVIISGGEYEVPSTVVRVTSGAVVNETNISVAGLNVTLTADQTLLGKTETTTVTATVTKPDGSPAVDVPVSLSATRGMFAEQSLQTNGTGQVTTTFTAGLNEVNDIWNAQVSYVATTDLAYSVISSGGQSINTQDTMLVGDATVAGTVTFDGYGVDVDIGYETTGTVAVRGNVGDTITIGDMSDPNLEPIISLPLNDIEFTELQGRFEDGHGINPAYINRGHNVNLDDDVLIVNDHPLGAGRSAHFKAESKLTIEANSLIGIADNSGFRLDLKPLGNGDIISFDKEGLRLSYSNEVLTLRVATDQGTYSTTVNNVTLGQWHSVAANIQGDQLNLYVDGSISSTTISGILAQGNPLIIDSKVIQVGGLEARMRGFRVYDYGSLPLVSFSDDSTAVELQAANEILEIKSLGNLGQRVANSQLTGLRVALISDSERNYASVLSQAGYQDIALGYLYSVSPEVPLASITNPLPGIVPTAHAWSWDGVWDGVKSTVGFLIPYEDFIIIAEQLSYLINQDWERFDPTALAFASLGAATIIPLAKPLKPLLGPLKKVVDGMKRFPAARHFAGAVGTAVKSALGGKTEKILNLLPFILIAVEIFKEPDVFEFMMSAIESEDDFWVWADYVAGVADSEGGLDLASLYPVSEQFNLTQNPLPMLVPDAYAVSLTVVRVAASKIIQHVKVLIGKISLIAANTVTKALRVLRGTRDLFRIVLKSGGTAIRYFAALGAARISYFVRESRNWRVNRWFVLFAVIFLEEERQSGRLNATNIGLLGVISKVFSKNKNDSAGALFQLSQIAYYHGRSLILDGQPKVLAIEARKPSYVVVNGEKAPGRPYNRRVDIIIEGPDNEGENWIEVKSLIKSGFQKNQYKNNPLATRSTKYKEFFHDLRLNENFITQNIPYQNLILEADNSTTNDLYTWYFHKFSRGRNRLNSPGTTQEKNVRGYLCAEPDGQAIGNDFYRYNMALSPGLTEDACKATSRLRIKLRDTESYVTEIIEGLVFKLDLPLSDFVAMIKSIPADSEWY